MTLSNEPFTSIYPTFHPNNSLPLQSSILQGEANANVHPTLSHQLSTKVLNLWTHALNVYCKAWWIKIFTEQPKCTYYFVPFAGAQEAEVASIGFVEDLEAEFAQGIKIKIDRHCQPDLLTIEHETIELLGA